MRRNILLRDKRRTRPERFAETLMKKRIRPKRYAEISIDEQEPDQKRKSRNTER